MIYFTQLKHIYIWELTIITVFFYWPTSSSTSRCWLRSRQQQLLLRQEKVKLIIFSCPGFAKPQSNSTVVYVGGFWSAYSLLYCMSYYAAGWRGIFDKEMLYLCILQINGPLKVLFLDSCNWVQYHLWDKTSIASCEKCLDSKGNRKVKRWHF